MSPALKQLYVYVVSVVIATLAILYIGASNELTAPTETINEEIAIGTPVPNEAANEIAIATTTPEALKIATPKPVKVPPAKTAPAQTPEPQTPSVQSENEAYRILEPYATEPQPFPVVNDIARAALVNVFCTGQGGAVRPISASGVMIDLRGVILTNAHVAQYVLLASDPRVNLDCVARIGSPARAKWFIDVLYIPPVWIELHANDISASRPVGTGEYDYALLRITGSSDSIPGAPAYLLPDTREAIGFTEDQVLVASYPAEFVAGTSAYFDLNAVSTVTTIKELLTFEKRSVDAVSLGGVIGAQSGSSGGAVVNAWGRIIGLITTTSEGSTTAERNLRAITLSYIDRDFRTRTGSGLRETLASDLVLYSQFFRENQAPQLIQLLMNAIENR